jgi:hypothetical protein
MRSGAMLLPVTSTTLVRAAGELRGQREEQLVDNAFDEVARLYRYSECDVATCGGIVYGVTTRPRMIGLRFNQKF